MRRVSVAVGEAVKRRKGRTISLDAEYCTSTPTATRRCCPIERVAGYKQPGVRNRTIAAACESVKCCKTGAISTDPKHCAVIGGAAIGRCAIQRIVRQYQRAG